MSNFYISLTVLAILLSILKAFSTEVVIMDYSDLDPGSIDVYHMNIEEDTGCSCECGANRWWE